MATNSSSVPPLYGPRQGKHSAGNPDCLGESSDGKTEQVLRLFINNGSDGVHRQNSIGLFVKMYDKREKEKKKKETRCNETVEQWVVGKREPSIKNK